ncbi:UPF0161 protein At3g09310 [Linum perenne]
MIAYNKYGFSKGTVLTVWRLCRCNPLGILYIPLACLMFLNFP